MNFNLYKKIIDQIKVLDVPSIKLNWRGEPLLNSKIDKYIEYAKSKIFWRFQLILTLLI